jgi:hypothetical protein
VRGCDLCENTCEGKSYSSAQIRDAVRAGLRTKKLDFFDTKYEKDKITILGPMLSLMGFKEWVVCPECANEVDRLLAIDPFEKIREVEARIKAANSAMFWESRKK